MGDPADKSLRLMLGARVAPLGILPYIPMKIYEYNRKSTKDKEDQQVLSIAGQHEENEKAARRLGHEIVRTFDEEKSAKEPGREEFNQMLDRIQRGEAEAIGCWRSNRLARNTIDGGRLVWMLQNGILKAIITPEKTYLPTDNILPLLIEFGMATQFSIDLGKDVMRGMLQKAKMGWRPGIAPVGYLNDYGGIKGEKKIFTDLDRFALVRRCWEHLLSGAYTVEEILALALNEWKLTVVRGRARVVSPICLNTLYDIFHNKFYYGEYDWGGQTWQGLHEPMITKAEFDRAQDILGSRGRPRSQTHENPYPCLINCGECGACVVLDTQKVFVKRENREKILCYFRCSKQKKNPCNQKHCIRQEKLDPQILKGVIDAELPQAFIDWALQKLKLTQEDKKKQREADLQRLHDGHKLAEKRVSDLIDQRLENRNLIPEDAFKRKIDALNLEVKRCEARIKDFGKQGRTWREEFIDKLLFVEKARYKFENGNPKTRIEMLIELKASLELKDRELTFLLQEPFRTLSRGKDRMKAELGSLEVLNCRLDQVKSDVLERIVPIWSR